jgi:hypothetical protein
MNSRGLQIELPDDVREEVARRTGGDQATAARWVADAVRERLTALREMEYLEERAARGSREAFDRVLAKAPPSPPVPEDEL